MEKLLSVKITVHIETDKSIFHKSFDSIEDATKFVEDKLKEINK